MSLLVISPHPSSDPYPFELLLDADPSEQRVRNYLSRGKCWTAKLDGSTVGVYVLLPTRPDTLELVNVAVAPDFQGQGIGKKLVLHAIETASKKGAASLEVGTGNSGDASTCSLSKMRVPHHACRSGFLYPLLSRTYL